MNSFYRATAFGLEGEHTSIYKDNPILRIRSIGYDEGPAALPHVQSGVRLREGRIPLMYHKAVSVLQSRKRKGSYIRYHHVSFHYRTL